MAPAVDQPSDRARSWAEVPAASVRSANGPHPLMSLLVPVVLVVVLVLIGWVVPAALVLIAAVALLALRVVRPAVHDRVLDLMARFGAAVAAAIGAVLLASTYAVVFVPVAAISWVFRHNPLAVGRDLAWLRRATEPVSLGYRSFAAEPGVGGGAGPFTIWSALRLIPLTAGWLVVALVVNYVAGYGWDLLVDDSEPPPVAAVAVAAGEPDPRASEPAFADSPWAADYLAELSSLEYEYLPFIESRMLPFSGRYINGGAGVRESHQAVGEDADVPEVWFLGGSTMWGEGQRDDHTIPSEIARLADEAGTPIRVVNLGERGYVSRQELELFDRELFLREAPDLAVFYDGTNDMNVQRENFNTAPHRQGAPTIYDVQARNEALADESVAAQQAETLYRRYERRSLVHELVDGLRGMFGAVPAGAAPAGDDPGGLVERTLAVYQQTRGMIRGVADEHGVETRFFWQPEMDSLDENSDYAQAARRVGSPTIDISGALAGLDPETVYIDGGHTNELGARVVAEAMWEHLAPVVADLSEDG